MQPLKGERAWLCEEEKGLSPLSEREKSEKAGEAGQGQVLRGPEGQQDRFRSCS